jgi:hypothetical protein
VKDIALILACLALMTGIAAVAYASITGRRT